MRTAIGVIEVRRADFPLIAGTDPFNPDSDGDTVADGSDAFPLDPTRSTAPTGNPSDTTPPVITLSEPTNAVLVP